MEELAQQFVATGDIPGVVLLAKDKHGQLFPVLLADPSMA